MHCQGWAALRGPTLPDRPVWSSREAYAALAVFAALAFASAARISESFCCTCWEKTYCAGRWVASEISGAIGPSVRTPRSHTHSVLSGLVAAIWAAVGS